MALYIVPFFVLQTVGYLAIAYSLWTVSSAPERTVSFRIFFIIVIFALVGALLRAIAFYFFNHSALLSFARSHTEVGAAFELFGVQLVAISWILKPLLFRSLRQPLKRADYVFGIFNWLILASLPTFLFDRFGYGAIVGLGTCTVIGLVAGWSLRELRGLGDGHDSTVRLMRASLYIFILTHAFFLAYNINFIFVHDETGDVAQSYLTADLFMRVCRISLFFLLDALCLFYWWQHHSTSAVQAQANRKKIELSLIEKDLLIKNLINANALIQTGAMTAGLSHEINQFLARIQLDVDSAKARLAHRGVDDVLPILSRALDANTGAAALVQNIKRLFVRHDQDLTQCDIDKLIRSVAQLYLARAKLSKIVLTLDLRANVQVAIRETLMRQVVSNLIVNGIDALESVERQEKEITVETYVEDDRWVLRVLDNASGIRSENAHKIFSLFSTTKSNGTGVGLWLSRYIVEEHGGHLRFANRESEGVVFWVEMPIQAIEGSSSNPAPALLFPR